MESNDDYDESINCIHRTPKWVSWCVNLFIWAFWVALVIALFAFDVIREIKIWTD